MCGGEGVLRGRAAGVRRRVRTSAVARIRAARGTASARAGPSAKIRTAPAEAPPPGRPPASLASMAAVDPQDRRSVVVMTESWRVCSRQFESYLAQCHSR